MFNENLTKKTMEKKSLWELPGGNLGMVVTALLIGGGLIGLYRILPYLIELAENTLYFSLMLGALAGIIFLVTNKQVRQTVKIGFFMIMRKITGWVVEIDPIAIVERRIIDMKKKIQEIAKIMGELKGHIRNGESDLEKSKKEWENTIQRAQVLEKQGDVNGAVVQKRQTVRLKEDCELQIKNLGDSKKWYEVLCKIEKMAQYTVEDTENEVEMRKKQFERIKKQHKAFKSVMSIIQGDPDEMAIFNQAMDFMALDMDKKLGEMEHIILNAGGLLSEFDANNGVASLKAQEIFAKYDQLGIDGILNSFITLPSGEESKQISQTLQSRVGEFEFTPYQEVEKVPTVSYFSKK
jgi:hypothetical protein